MNILHITDLHIKDPNSTKEHLSVGFYIEYIDGLISEINRNEEKIDALVITGDFTEKGNIDNYDHSKLVIKYLSEKLEIHNENVIICSGNHDLQRELDLKEEYVLSRKPLFNVFKDIDTKDKIINENTFFTLKDLEINAVSLVVDSTRNKGVNKPGFLTTEEEDEIIKSIQDAKIPDSKILLISTHYPIEHFTNSTFYQHENQFEEYHFWRKGGRLRNRIIDNTSGIQKLWFCGDTHLSQHQAYGENLFVMTGRLGGEVFDKDLMSQGINEEKDFSTLTKKLEEFQEEIKNYSNQRRQAKLIRLKETKVEDIITFTFEMEGHVDDPRSGKWISGLDQHILHIEKDKKRNKEKKSSTVPQKTIACKSFDCISISLSRTIYERIAQEKLYKFGKHFTTKDLVSLGWICTHKLLNNTHILPRIIDESKRWIKNLKLPKNKFLILGIDYWGFSIVSNLSVQFNIENFCFSSRNPKKYYSKNETIPVKQICKYVQENTPQHVIIVTDVIGTGSTLLRKLNKIKKIFKFNKLPSPKFYAITVLSDTKNTSNGELFEFEKIGTFCDDIRIPLIDKQYLPNEDILPHRIKMI